jgi:GT2 family glycosyltransferase
MSDLSIETHLSSGTQNTPHIPVVILHWGPADTTVRCLESLQKAAWPGRRTVLVIDNTGRLDDDEVKHLVPLEVEIHRPVHNLGFSRGCTLGISLAIRQGADFVLLLNNDAVVDPHFLGPLLDAASHMSDAGLVSPQIVLMEDPHKAWYRGGTFSLWVGIPAQGYRKAALDPSSLPREVDYATGCAMLIRPALIRRIGSFDPRFFAYCEDVDLSLRARRSGFRVLFVPASIVHHEVNRQSRRVSLRIYYTTRNLLELMRKHAAWHMWVTFSAHFLVRWLGYFAALGLLRGRPAYVMALMQGLSDFAMGKFDQSVRVNDERGEPLAIDER